MIWPPRAFLAVHRRSPRSGRAMPAWAVQHIRSAALAAQKALLEAIQVPNEPTSPGPATTWRRDEFTSWWGWRRRRVGPRCCCARLGGVPASPGRARRQRWPRRSRCPGSRERLAGAGMDEVVAVDLSRPEIGVPVVRVDRAGARGVRAMIRAISRGPARWRSGRYP